MKKFSLLFTVLFGTFILGSAIASAEAPLFFSDMEANRDHPYYDAVEQLRRNNIVSGNPDGTFGPDNSITRAAFTKIVMEAVMDEVPEWTGGPCFPDVATGEWYEKYVCAAKDQGVIGGYPDGTFGPGNNVNVAEASKIVYEGFGVSVTPGEQWYSGYIDHAMSNTHMPDFWNPVNPISRGGMAYYMARVLEYPIWEAENVAAEYNMEGDPTQSASFAGAGGGTETSEDPYSEIYIDEVTADSDEEYVSIRNYGSSDVQMQGFRLSARNGESYTFGSYNLEAGGTVYIYSDADDTWHEWELAWEGPEDDLWDPEDGSLTLYAPDGTEVDYQSW